MAVWIDNVIRLRWLSLIWIRIFEPLLRFWPSYPPDWELRRMLVFERAQGRCEYCRAAIGSIFPRDDGWHLSGAHVHHAKPISRGGRHGLANLRLICARCHCAQHPENAKLREMANVALPSAGARRAEARRHIQDTLTPAARRSAPRATARRR